MNTNIQRDFQICISLPLRRECRQTPSTEQLLHQTDKNSHWLKISQYSQENSCVESFLNDVACLQACNFIRTRLQHRRFAVANFLRKSIMKNDSKLTLGNDCLELCFWTVPFKTILTQQYYKNTSRFQTRALNRIWHVCRLYV